MSVTPDDIRDIACDATAGSNICRIPEPTELEPIEFDPPSVSGAGGGGGGGFGIVLIVLLIAAILAGVAWLAKAWLDGRSASSDDGDQELDEELEEELDARIIDHETPPDRWRRHAAEHRDGGRFRDAVRCEYRALVGDLARARLVDEIPGRTSGEERTQIAEIAPGLSGDFDDAADRFDIAWFDDDEVTAADDDRFVAAARAVLDGVMAR